MNSPSQNTQSHAHKKHVVARGLWHKLHDKDGAAIGRLDEATDPLEVPGGAILLVIIYGNFYSPRRYYSLGVLVLLSLFIFIISRWLVLYYYSPPVL